MTNLEVIIKKLSLGIYVVRGLTYVLSEQMIILFVGAEKLDTEKNCLISIKVKQGSISKCYLICLLLNGGYFNKEN